ncbi:MAG: YegP family protein [Vicinamibacteria bacterium]
MAGKFEIFKDKAGEFRFRLRASNGEIVLASEGYRSKAGATNGAASVKKNCRSEKCFEKKPASSGKYRFIMKARNHQVIGTSQIYPSEAARDKGIKAIARAAGGAKSVDLTK